MTSKNLHVKGKLTVLTLKLVSFAFMHFYITCKSRVVEILSCVLTCVFCGDVMSGP